MSLVRIVELGKEEIDKIKALSDLNNQPVLLRDEHHLGLLYGVLNVPTRTPSTTYSLQTTVNGAMELHYHDLKEIAVLPEQINLFGDVRSI